MQINLTDAISQQLEGRVKDSDEFSSVEEYVNYVLAEVLKQTGGEGDQYTKEQEDAVKDRLESLGYLD